MFLVTAIEGARSAAIENGELYVEFAPEARHLRDSLAKSDSVKMLRDFVSETAETIASRAPAQLAGAQHIQGDRQQLDAHEQGHQVLRPGHHGGHEKLARREDPVLRMDGHTTFNAAVGALVRSTRAACELSGVALDDIDLFVYHQANARILAAVGERLGLDDERVINCIDRYGNTSSATLPIALADARERGLLEPGMNVLLAAFNMLPLPPLDGSAAMPLVMSAEAARRYQEVLWSTPMLNWVGLFLAWKVFPLVFHPIFFGAVHLLYPWAGYS